MLSISLGPLSLPVGHILIIIAFVVAVIVGALLGRKQQIPVFGPLCDIFMVAVISARIGFVLMYFEHYQNDLWGIIDIRDGGFSLVFGTAGALLCTGWLMWRHRLIRRPLGSAVVSGFLTWSLVTLSIHLIETEASKVPESTFTMLDGTKTTLADVADGKPMVVNLWATWCPPCVREMPVLDAAQKQHPDIAFIFVNQGEHAEAIEQFLTEQSLNLNHVMLDMNGSLGRSSGSQALPTTLFFAADGRQVDSHLGELSQATLARSLEKFPDKFHSIEP